MLYQQGDVLLKKVKVDLKNAKKLGKTNGRYILAEGEATGHAHAVLDNVEMYDQNGILFVNAPMPFSVVHEEHNKIEIPQGLWRVEKVREYDHFAKRKIFVAD